MISSFLTFCSGTNHELLAQCPRQERIRQRCIGGIILGTAALAFWTGEYALYTVFGNPWLSVIFGFMWGLIIFNLDRFFVSSFAKDGSILKELKSGLPRIALAMIIGIVISEPLKLKLFESEITEHLNDRLVSKNAVIDAEYDKKIRGLKKEIENKNLAMQTLRKESVRECETIRDTNNAQITRLKSEISGKNTLAQGTCDITEKEMQQTRDTNHKKIAGLKDEIAQKDAYKQSLYKRHLDECAGLAGTMKRGEGKECKRTLDAYRIAEKEWNEIRDVNQLKIKDLEKETEAKNKARIMCYQQAMDKTEKEWQSIREAATLKIADLEHEIAEKDQLAQAYQKKLETDFQQVRERITDKIAELERLADKRIQKATQVFAQGFLARHTALKEIVKKNNVQAIYWTITLMFIMLEISPVIAKWMQPKGSYDYILQTVNNGFIQKQTVIQDVENSIFSREYHDYLRIKRLSEIKYDEILIPYDKCKTYLDNVIRESEDADKKFRGWFFLADKIKDIHLKQQTENGIKTMIDIFGEAQDISFAKFRELLKTEAYNRTSDTGTPELRVYN